MFTTTARAGECYGECYNEQGRISNKNANFLSRPHPVGEWLSLVEHLVRDQGVGGSNPLSPTISFQTLTIAPTPKNVSTWSCTRGSSSFSLIRVFNDLRK